MRENLLTLRLRNARLERELGSRPARRAVRRIRAELGRRGLTAAQCERVLHDNLLMLAECEEAGGDAVEALLGTTSVSEYDAAIASFCEGVAAECPRLPVPLVIVRFFALLLVVLGVVMGAHLVEILARPAYGWLDPSLVSLTNLDAARLSIELLSVPVAVMIAQLISSVIPRNPARKTLVVVLALVLFALEMAFLRHQTLLFSQNGFWAFDMASGAIFSNLMGALAVGTSVVTWMAVSRVGAVAVVLAMLVVGAGTVYLIEQRGLSA